MRARQREWRAAVVEGCACPVCSGVASVAGSGEARRGMCRIVGTIPVRQVATKASSGQRAVIGGSTGVALNALHGRVEARQRERGRTVVKGRGRPVGG